MDYIPSPFGKVPHYSSPLTPPTLYFLLLLPLPSPSPPHPSHSHYSSHLPLPLPLTPPTLTTPHPSHSHYSSPLLLSLPLTPPTLTTLHPFYSHYPSLLTPPTLTTPHSSPLPLPPVSPDAPMQAAMRALPPSTWPPQSRTALLAARAMTLGSTLTSTLLTHTSWPWSTCRAALNAPKCLRHLQCGVWTCMRI